MERASKSKTTKSYTKGQSRSKLQNWDKDDDSDTNSEQEPLRPKKNTVSERQDAEAGPISSGAITPKYVTGTPTEKPLPTERSSVRRLSSKTIRRLSKKRVMCKN